MRVLPTIDNRVVDLLAEDYDVAVRIGPLQNSDLIAHRLTTLQLWPCANPAYLMVVPGPDVVRTLLLADVGIRVFPDFHAASAIASGTLVRALPEYEHLSVDVHALYLSHRSLTAKVRVFIDALVQVGAEQNCAGRELISKASGRT